MYNKTYISSIIIMILLLITGCAVQNSNTKSANNSACDSLECFSQLAQTCTVGELTHDYSSPLPLMPNVNLVINAQTHLSINGKTADGESCELSQTSLGGTITASPPQNDSNLNSQIQAMNDSLNDPTLLNTVVTCTGSPENISTYITNFEQNSAATSCKAAPGQTETHCTLPPDLDCVAKIKN